MTPEWIRLTCINNDGEMSMLDVHVPLLATMLQRFGKDTLIMVGGVAEAVRETPDEIMALLGIDARPTQTAPQPPNARSASEPQVAGADPPWLDEAAKLASNVYYGFTTGRCEGWATVVRAVLAYAAAQPPTSAEIDAAIKVAIGDFRWGATAHTTAYVTKILIAAAKGRAPK